MSERFFVGWSGFFLSFFVLSVMDELYAYCIDVIDEFFWVFPCFLDKEVNELGVDFLRSRALHPPHLLLV